jgi:hypothetical protein
VVNSQGDRMSSMRCGWAMIHARRRHEGESGAPAMRGVCVHGVGDFGLGGRRDPGRCPGSAFALSSTATGSPSCGRSRCNSALAAASA